MGTVNTAGAASEQPLELSTAKLVIHIVGIGGAGMRAIAKVLIEMGHQVTGSDIYATEHVKALRELGVTVHVGHSPDVVTGVDLVAHSSAIGPDNIELETARTLEIPVVDRATLLGSIVRMAPKTVLVAGTHGKTTTSALTVCALEEAGAKPSFIVGADIAKFGTGARWVDGSVLVVEADESDGTFLKLEADAAVLTSVDPDHLDFYGSVANLESAFVHFIKSVDGPVVLCADDPDARRIMEEYVDNESNIVTYGTTPDCAFRISDITSAEGKTSATVGSNRFEIALPGVHNVLNATAALSIGVQLGYEPDSLAEGITRFAGVSRRFERIGSVGGVTVIDDYAHLPAEVLAVTRAARCAYEGSVRVVFQPHRYTRTRDIGEQFSNSFEAVTQLYITKLYPAGEKPIDGVSAKNLFDAVQHDNKDWIPELDDVVQRLINSAQRGDVIMTLGAGDVTQASREIVTGLRQRQQQSPERGGL